MAKTLNIDITSLTDGKAKTYLAADVTSGTILNVQSVNGFSGSISVLIGEIGQEETEIVAIHASATASGTAVYLASNIGKSHSQDTPVYAIDWNQIEVTHASTSAASSGINSTLSYGTNILPDRTKMSYKDTSKSSGWYFIRFVDTVGSGYSDYSDAIPYDGYPDNSVFSIKERALEKVGAEIDDNITHDFLNNSLWEARREYHQAPGKRPFRRKYNQDIGNVGTGNYRTPVPSDLEKPTSGENVYGIRIGAGKEVNYYDKKDYDFDYENVAHSVLLYDIGATSVTSFSVSNGRDFDASGAVQIENDTIDYTARSVSTGSFTVSLTGTTHTANADVWQGISFGLPTNFTVFQNPEESAYIYFSCPFDTAYVDQNIWCDYYRTLVPYDSDADVLDEPDYDMFVHYLAYRIKKKLNPSLDDQKDSDYLEWLLRKSNALKNEYLGTEVKFIPDIQL